MNSNDETIALVAGGAGQVGARIVRAFLNRDATVIVPSRSQKHLTDLHKHLESADTTTDQLTTIVGNIGQIDSAQNLRKQFSSDSVGSIQSSLRSAARSQSID